MRYRDENQPVAADAPAAALAALPARLAIAQTPDEVAARLG